MTPYAMHSYLGDASKPLQTSPAKVCNLHNMSMTNRIFLCMYVCIHHNKTPIFIWMVAVILGA